MKTRISDLDERQRAVTLMLDEIHIKPFFDYKGGNIAGMAQNSPEAATAPWFLWYRAFAVILKKLRILYLYVAPQGLCCTTRSGTSFVV